jgi:mannose-1-phosphate guanylyltransferase
MIVPVILSGGSGTRLWPLSRKLFPKQFLNLFNKTSLFQDTILRLKDQYSSPLIICNEEHRFIVAEQLRQIKSKNQGIILEPVGKNTAPAITLAALNLLSHGKDPIMLVLSADHLIKNEKTFIESIKIASNFADTGKMLAIGIKPTKPEVGYGYIEADNSEEKNCYQIISFTEKPSHKVAENYLDSGKFYWNSGIFLFKASTYLSELKKFEPDILKTCKKSFANIKKDFDFIRPDSSEFKKCPEKSIDYAIMEKTQSGMVVPFDGSWSDVGTWNALWNSQSKDLDSNVVKGDVILQKVKNSFIHSSRRLVTVNDVSDIIIVDTSDALLVSSKKSSQEIKHLVAKIKTAGKGEADNHRKVFRPWGYYDSIESGDGFQVKRIYVNPGAKLSLQKHKKRAEHWVVVKGIAKITCGDRIFKLNENESTYIPKGEIHRLENQEKTPLEIIEIQTGMYLGEDDIIRLEDDYHRN